MRKLIALVLLAALGWSVWWFIGANAVETGLTRWLDRPKPVATRYAEVNTTGFPNRFDTTITKPRLVNRSTGATWAAPFVQILALSYKPNHIILALPPRQTVTLPGAEFEIASERLRGSVVFAPDTDLALKRTTFEAEALDISGPLRLALEDALLATRRNPGSELAHDISLTIDTLRPDAGLVARIDPEGRLPETVERLFLDATATFDRPLDRHAIRDPALLTAFEIGEATLVWGDLRLTASGALEVGADGRPTGSLDVEVTGWRTLLDLAIATGLLDRDLAPTVRQALSLLANGDELSVPLDFREGRVFLGPVPIGRAPRLR